ncbi:MULTISPECIES: RHS repeat-associated core domain-containing protein [unclassified Ruminococcus]|uniref:RHS repeat-associated core domain-containing protein n=1 Tax=unclassified Ruminococcus TaxID=2608920 RepID=UPI00210E0943|nr:MULTISPECIES: RHS repeat-associated core domain-containing protein [unclassified Ruminococcus]MCQ4021691.1 hypothetical protein [Ruminococcus sp. zg-924]MCQ4114136.1 hypothetical protein [Ruminococcus sp. zg-921]
MTNKQKNITISEKVYYYTHNWRGDIVGIYNGNGDLKAKYTYDSWGNVTSIKDGNGNAITDPNHVGNLNPFRYRGYYMDTETGMYYLMSRYYDPVTHRFLNADGYFQTGLGVLDSNMNAYCKNNPVNCADPNGEFWGIVALVSFAAIFVASLISAIVIPDNPVSGASAKATNKSKKIKSSTNIIVGTVESGVYNEYSSNPIGNDSKKPITFSATGRTDNYLLSSANCSLNIVDFSVGANIGGDEIGLKFSNEQSDCIDALSIYFDPSSLSFCVELGHTIEWDKNKAVINYDKISISGLSVVGIVMTYYGINSFPISSPTSQPCYA